MRGGDNGPAVVPGKARESRLYKRVHHEEQPGMPFQGKKLSDDAIAAIAEWIDAGAPYDAPLTVKTAAHTALPGSNHWAFQAPRKPAVPAVRDRAWVRNPIDAFIAREHEKRGLQPVPAADKATLLRRVYLDLIGLPPTLAELRAFAADSSKDAYEKVVDRLLASPRYGERWGRHWMDVWRYSDWYGRRAQDDQRNSARHIWRWRDWIIESLNDDKPYNRMIVEMLAGDEIAPGDPNVLRATGYLARDFYRFNRNVWMQDAVEHTAAAFLGITMKCARCHDHKYDPIAQEEYYRLRAFFEPYDVRVDRVPGEPDPDKDGLARVFDGEPREGTSEAPFIPAIYANTYRLIRGDENNPDKSTALTPGIPEILGHGELKIEPVKLPLEAYNPDIRPFVHKDLIAQAKAEVEKAEARLERAQEAVTWAHRRMERDTLPAAAANRKTVDFDKEVKPLFENNCFSCHTSKNDKSGLALDSPEAILRGGVKNGAAAIPRNSKESPLILYLRGEKKPRMPLDGRPLSEDQIARIAQWIDSLPEDSPPVALKKAENAVALAAKELEAARANVPALEARIAADKAKYAVPKDPAAEKLADAARKAERHYGVLKAQADLLRAEQELAEAVAAGTEQEKTLEMKAAAARKAAQAAAAALGQAADTYTPVAKAFPSTSSGRRTALARWIASSDNPLTARVAINHIWLRHVGKALVPTVVNFGRNGKPPTHPELLDWLAVYFMESGWSMKSVHRLIVTSNAYRMRSWADVNSTNAVKDPENRYLWRMNPRRMEAEAVRDSMLYLAGHLDTSMGGPDIDENRAEEVHRRSVYFRHTPDSQVLFLKLFDQPDPTDCYTRTESIVPQQALALSNSNLSFSQARLLARQISKQVGENASELQFIAQAFETVLNRPPTAAEAAKSAEFLRQQAEMFQRPETLKTFKAVSIGSVPPSSDARMRAREDLVHALFNHHDFVTVR